jgi:hypothetical protein
LSQWRNQSPKFHFSVDFTTHFPTESVMCQCSNVGLQFILVKQIHNVQLLECRKNYKHALHHLSKLILPFLGVEMMRYSTETTTAWFLGHTCKPTSHYLWLSSKGILGLFQASLEGPSTCWHDSPTALFQAGHDSASCNCPLSSLCTSMPAPVTHSTLLRYVSQ